MFCNLRWKLKRLMCKHLGHKGELIQGITVSYWWSKPDGQWEHVYKYFSDKKTIFCSRCKIQLYGDTLDMVNDKADREIRTPYTKEMAQMNAVAQTRYGTPDAS